MLLVRANRVLGARFLSSGVTKAFDQATLILASENQVPIPDLNFVDFVWRDHKKWENRIAMV